MPGSTWEDRQRETQKRKIPSPIKPGPDYNLLLRKQELSASPALKRSKDRSGGVRSGTVIAEEEEDSDEEVTFVKNSEMPKDSSEPLSGQDGARHLPLPRDQGTPSFTCLLYTSDAADE